MFLDNASTLSSRKYKIIIEYVLADNNWMNERALFYQLYISLHEKPHLTFISSVINMHIIWVIQEVNIYRIASWFESV